MTNATAAAPAKKTPAPKEAKAATRSVTVEATRMGYYGLKRVREGQRFTIQLGPDQQLPTWVKLVGAKAAPAPAADDDDDSGDGDAGTGPNEPVI